MQITTHTSLPGGFDKRLAPDHEDHRAYVRLVQDFDRYYTDQSETIWKKANDWWDLFLAIQADLRDPLDEGWRSDVFVPLPFSVTRTKAAQTTELLGNTEPVWQVEAAREEGDWYEQARHSERLLDYVARMNRIRKLIYKLATSRSVQGTTWLKAVWGKRSHLLTMYPSQAEFEAFQTAVQEASQVNGLNAPDYLRDPEGFASWRDLVNKAAMMPGAHYKPVPEPPVGGLRELVEYEGPVLQQLPLWSVRVDARVDEVQDQKLIIHRMVKPLSAILDRADNDPNSNKPYLRSNVEAAMHGWDGEVLQKEERHLAEALGLNPAAERHPYYEKAVLLWEVWSSDEKFRYAVIMNEQAVINKRPFENMTLTTHPNVFALRNVLVPGHFYGLSDYQEPEKLFRELNQFRRIRMDGATLTTLPVFVKQSGVQLTEAFRKLKPGMIIPLPGGPQAIQSLIRHSMPAEAYREPAEIKMEIEDATEVYSSTKGQPAQVGRVTGVEFQGRAGQTSLKYKIDATIFEEELMMLPTVMLAFFAQMGPEHLQQNIAGDPGRPVDLTREKLVQAINMRFRFRGAVKHINSDLQVQQITTALREFQDVLTPPERRQALQLVMELLDIRGYSKILTMEGTQQITAQAAMQAAAGNAQAGAATQQAQAAGVQAPAEIGPQLSQILGMLPNAGAQGGATGGQEG